jgi:hypothetical protein
LQASFLLQQLFKLIFTFLLLCLFSERPNSFSSRNLYLLAQTLLQPCWFASDADFILYVLSRLLKCDSNFLDGMFLSAL